MKKVDFADSREVKPINNKEKSARNPILTSSQENEILKNQKLESSV